MPGVEVGKIKQGFAKAGLGVVNTQTRQGWFEEKAREYGSRDILFERVYNDWLNESISNLRNCSGTNTDLEKAKSSPIPTTYNGKILVEIIDAFPANTSAMSELEILRQATIADSKYTIIRSNEQGMSEDDENDHSNTEAKYGAFESRTATIALKVTDGASVFLCLCTQHVETLSTLLRPQCKLIISSPTFSREVAMIDPSNTKVLAPAPPSGKNTVRNIYKKILKNRLGLCTDEEPTVPVSQPERARSLRVADPVDIQPSIGVTEVDNKPSLSQSIIRPRAITTTTAEMTGALTFAEMAEVAEVAALEEETEEEDDRFRDSNSYDIERDRTLPTITVAQIAQNSYMIRSFPEGKSCVKNLKIKKIVDSKDAADMLPNHILCVCHDGTKGLRVCVNSSWQHLVRKTGTAGIQWRMNADGVMLSPVLFKFDPSD
eukprot:Clim_evm83s11 gene=Clim_evmTU83s11